MEPLTVSRIWNVHRTCVLAVPVLFFLHRREAVTPSWFKAVQSHVLRVPNGNGKKKWSSPSSGSTPSHVGLICGCKTEEAFLHAYFIVQRHS